MILNDELERMQKEVVIVFKVQFQHLPGGPEEKCEKS
jgi:hypothetical protein